MENRLPMAGNQVRDKVGWTRVETGDTGSGFECTWKLEHPWCGHAKGLHAGGVRKKDMSRRTLRFQIKAAGTIYEQAGNGLGSEGSRGKMFEHANFLVPFKLMVMSGIELDI